MSRPLSEVNCELKNTADYHLSMLGNFQKGDKNYQYHTFRRKTLLAAIHQLEKAIGTLPSDFSN